MKIDEIKAALAAKAHSMHVQPIQTMPAEQLPAEKEKSDVKATSPTKAPQQKSTTTTHQVIPNISADDIDSIIATNLKAGIDYAVIPGCGRKPALLKAGAEHLAAIYDYRSISKIVHRLEDYQQSFVMYEVETTIFDHHNNIVATRLGSCNSRERKYARTDFATNLNTVLKMAKKRSYVDAILTACHASGTFTQDIEDIAASIRASKEA